MTQEEKRIKIAEACGITAYVHDLPDYFNDLNAMHEAERFASQNYTRFTWRRYKAAIELVMDEEGVAFLAAAAQRAEAFGLTLKLWEAGE